MKKLIFSFLILVIAGFAAQTLPVLAVTSPPAASVLGPEETKILAQTLNILKIVLENMRVLIASSASPIPNSAELNAGLEAIKGKLTLINSTIESQALAYAKRVGETKSVVLSKPVFSSPTAIKESPPLLRAEVSPNEPRKLNPVELRGEQTAALSESAGQGNRNILWVAVVLLAIVGALSFLEWKKKKEPKAATVVAEEPQKPIMPMVREDDIQGIPPDY
ncbi:MAG: hypothetical protein HYT13_00520 [Candidatus Liptonbacteria bacterium]|nr:hypothetical protein [Candidatus Liptonbacteria bacterium]